MHVEALRKQTELQAAIKAVSLLDVANALGLTPVGPQKADEGRFACPACGEETRHRKSRDKRGAINVGDSGWKCFQCERSGDALELIAWAMAHEPYAGGSSHAKRATMEWTERFLGPGFDHAALSLQREERERRAYAIAQTERELANELWKACRPITSDDGAVAWCDQRGIHAKMVASDDLARSLPHSVDAIRKRLGEFRDAAPRDWHGLGYRIVVPAYDHRGEIAAVRLRRVANVDGEPKTLGFGSFQAAVFVDAMARFWLQNSTAPSVVRKHFESTYPPELPNMARAIAFTEGESDLLRAATCYKQTRPACIFGVVAGSIHEPMMSALVRCWPKQWKALIATDNDKPGDEYARQIFNTIWPQICAGACPEALRWRPLDPQHNDICDARGLGHGRIETIQ